VDGVKSLALEQLMNLTNNLKITGKAKRTRRIMSPTANSDEKLHLGIPTINDRSLQALVKIAIEPE
jgi:RNA-directed DNA polymerase